MITIKETEHLAELARMELLPEELEHLTSEIDSILDYVGQISGITGEGAREVGPLHNVMREDVPTNAPGEYSEALLANAPSRSGAYIAVKKILGSSDDII